MREEYEAFAHNLNEYMKYYNISKTELAKRVDVAQSTVTGWIKAERYPRLGVMLNLLEIFHCSQDDLLNGFKTQEEIEQAQTFRRLFAYYSRLNPEGAAKVLAYMEDLNPKYFREENEK